MRTYTMSVITKLPNGTSSISGTTAKGKSVTDFVLDHLALIGVGRVVQVHIAEESENFDSGVENDRKQIRA